MPPLTSFNQNTKTVVGRGVFTFDHFLWGAATVASRAYGDDAEGRYMGYMARLRFGVP